jgi:hypothetical protein
MINMKQWMELVGYRITEGSAYCWQCFGPNAYTLDAWDGDNEEGYSLCIVFDTKTQEVYQVEVHDYKRKNAYRFTNPEYRDAHTKEERVRGAVDFDDYKITDLEVEDDWESKAFSIVNYADYDTGILVPLDFTDEELLPLFKAAHEANMSFNDYVCMALRNMIDRMKETGELPKDFGKNKSCDTKCCGDCEC